MSHFVRENIRHPLTLGADMPSRRDVLGNGAAALGLGLAATAISPTNVLAAVQPALRRIDFHHHMSPPLYTEASLRARGHVSESAGNTIKWSPELSIEDMDKAGIATAFLSLIIPGVWFGKIDPDMRTLARQCNEYAANLTRDYKGRFRSFAVIPIADTDGALREIEYSLDTLKADGIALWTSYSGKYLGDPSFVPVFEELNRRKAVVFTHPMPPDCCINLIKGVPVSTLEYTQDTTRTIASLVFGEAGTALRCPDIKFIWSHSGGTLPSLSLRMEELAAQRRQQFPNGVLPLFRKFYYDVAGNNPIQIAALLKMVDVSQVLFGSDFPYVHGSVVVRDLADSKLGPAAMRAIESGNAMRLMPQLRT